MTLPDILSDSEEGFADFVLAIVAGHEIDEGGRCFDVEATHEGERVGLRIEISRDWIARDFGDFVCHSGVITYRSLGDLSDRFVSLVDRLYGVGLNPAHMNVEVSFAALSLSGDPWMTDSDVIKIKLFFEHDDEERYAEVYTNFDLERGVVEIREKSEE